MAPQADKKHRRKNQIQVGVWCHKKLVAEIDRRASGMQEGRMERIHRSDVIRAILCREFGLNEAELEGDD